MGMDLTTAARAAAENALRAYEAAGRAVVDPERPTPEERQRVRTARDAYYGALRVLNAQGPK
jgi:hypothetical protein